MNPKKSLPMALAIASLVWAGTGCDRKEDINSYSVKPKSSTVSSVAEQNQAGQEDMTAGAAAGDLAWNVPASWQPLPPAPMRFASYSVSPDDPKAILTVLKLPPQPLLMNVNRWEGQLSLAPTPEAELSKVVKHFDINGLPADEVDLSGKNSAGQPERMLAALITAGQSTWSIKLTGSPQTVAAQQANFEAFLHSIHQGAAAAAPSMAAQGKSLAITGYQLPPGWTKDDRPNQFRYLSFKAGDADVAVTRMPQAGFDTEANLGRWLGQVGANDPKAIQRVGFRIGDQEVRGLDISGTTDDGPKRLLIAIAPEGPDFFFLRILGSSKAVADQKANFDAFLKSVKFGPSPE